MSFCNKTFFLLSVFVYGSEPKITEVVTTSEDSTSRDSVSHNGATPAADPFLVSTTTSYNISRDILNILHSRTKYPYQEIVSIKE